MGEVSGWDTHSVYMSSLVCHTAFLVHSRTLKIEWLNESFGTQQSDLKPLGRALKFLSWKE